MDTSDIYDAAQQQQQPQLPLTQLQAQQQQLLQQQQLPLQHQHQHQQLQVAIHQQHQNNGLQSPQHQFQQQMQCDLSVTQTTPFSAPNLTQMPHESTSVPSSQIPIPIQQYKDQANATPNSSNMDIDALLLQQFSCLGTTDHEDLIVQFMSLMNNKMNEATARFFLDMSNWNLQTAVGCYLDVCSFQTLPSMKILEETRTNEERQAWRLQNDGTESWPNGCYLMSPSQTRRIDIPAIKPGEHFMILADMPPSQQAVMFRLCTPNGWYFGEPIWIIPPGTADNPNDLAHRMSQLRTSPNGPICDDVQINIIMAYDMD